MFYVTAFKFDEFIEKLNRVVYSREIFYKFREELKSVKIDELGDVDAAVKWRLQICKGIGLRVVWYLEMRCVSGL